jgi:hypothetical protein
MRKSLEQCHQMHRMLSSYSGLPTPIVVVENGIRITKCPPAYARGAWPHKNVGSMYSKR